VETPRVAPAAAAPLSRGWATATLIAITAALVWAYFPVLVEVVRKWSGDPQYSHGYLVPAFALYLLWHRRRLAAPAAWRPNWWGLPVLAVALLLRLAGTYFFIDALEALSLLPFLAGTALLLAGPTALRWSWQSIAFLGFMFPLPYRLETALSLPLQRVATAASTYVLQTVGLPAFAEGNVIVVNDARVGVVEACNGLGMLLLFFAMATAVALVVRRSLVERLVLVASAAPIAVLANVARISVTAFLYEAVGGRVADAVFHDLAGWFMMPLALALLWLELAVMDRLVIDAAPPRRSARLGIPKPAAGTAEPAAGSAAS
jgi:exosortase